jgi:hypothetical protein
MKLAFPSPTPHNDLPLIFKRYHNAKRGPVISFNGNTYKAFRIIAVNYEPGYGFFHTFEHVRGVDWGRAPMAILEACPIVQTAALVLSLATRDPNSVFAAAEFAVDVMREFGDRWKYTAKGVQDWYREELAELGRERGGYESIFLEAP